MRAIAASCLDFETYQARPALHTCMHSTVNASTCDVCNATLQASSHLHERDAHRKVGMLRPEQESEGGSQVVVLPGRGEVVCHRQLMHGPALHNTIISSV